MAKNRLWPLLVILGLVLSLAACGPKATAVVEVSPTPAESVSTSPEGVTEVEPNNGPAEATKISIGLSTGRLGGDDDDEDWYKFEVPNKHLLSVVVTPGEDAEGTIWFHLFDPDQKEIEVKGDVSPTVTEEFSKLMGNSSGGVYYLKVGSGNRGSYRIELSTQSQDDADSGGDAGDEAVDALEVEASQTFSGQIGDFDDYDWYRFAPSVGQTISVTLNEEIEGTGGPWFNLFDSDLEKIESIAPVPGMTEEFEITEVVGESHYIQVSADFSEGNGSYTITVK